MSESNLKSIQTAAQAVSDSLPDAPQPRNQNHRQLSWFKVTFDASGTTGTAQPQMVDIVAPIDQALKNPNDPSYAQAVADVDAGIGLYSVIIGDTTCTSGAPIPKPTPMASAGGSSSASSCIPSPQTYTQYKALLKQYGSTMTFDAKIVLLSALGYKLNSLYNDDALNSVTPLPDVFAAIRNDTPTAGVCRDIHTFLAETATALGLQDAGTTNADWDNGYTTTRHAIAQFRDPATGNFVFLNYDTLTESNSRYLSEAAQEETENLNSISAATFVETRNASSKRVLHETQAPRTHAALEAIDRASEMDQAHLTIAGGTSHNRASFQMRLAGGDMNRIGVFAVGLENRQELPIQMGAAGVRADFGASSSISKNTRLELKGKLTAGVLALREESPGGGTQSEPAGFGDLHARGDFAWKSSSGQHGRIGIRTHGTGTLYFNRGLGMPSAILAIEAIEAPKRSIAFHAESKYFIATQNTQDISPALHHLDDVAGVRLRKHFASGRVSLSDDVNLHFMGGVGSGAYGIHNEAKIHLRAPGKGDFGLSSDTGWILNSSGDVYYDYAPVVGSIKGSYRRKLRQFTLEGSAQYNYNRQNEFTLLQNDSTLSDPGWRLSQPRARVSLRIRW